jgi:hypothetical protein
VTPEVQVFDGIALLQVGEQGLFGGDHAPETRLLVILQG